MAIATLTPRNQPQVLGSNVQADGNPNTIGTTAVVVYTCPAGKQCLVTNYQVRFSSFGANTSMFVNARLRRMREALTVEQTMVESVANGIRLAAGETLTLTGNSGSNNGSAFFIFSGTELPA